MINLIPNKERKEMVRCFYLKLTTLFLIVGSFVFIAFFVAILPSYFLSSVKNNIVDKKLETQNNEIAPLPDQKTLSVIKNLSNELDLVERVENNKFIVSEKIINAILLKKMSNIKIINISFEDKTPNGSSEDKKISIQGYAPSREVLLLFRKALEDDANFKQVDLPISNFVKGSNIQFYLSLIPS